MTQEEALVIWDTINDLFKTNDIEPSFFYNDVREWDKVDVNGYYDSFYFEFNLDRSKDKTILAKISHVLCLPELDKYRVSYSNKNYFNNEYWRLGITLFSEK